LVAVLPFLSNAIIVIVFVPFERLIVLLNEPLEATETSLPFTVTLSIPDSSVAVPFTTTKLVPTVE